MKSLFKVMVVLLFVALPISSQASDLDKAVRGLERDFGMRHQHIPMLGFALFSARVATAFQMPHVRLAIFADENVAQASPQEMQRSLLTALGPDWSPVIKTTLHHGNEQNLVLVRPDGGRVHMLIADLEQREVSLVEVQMSEKQMQKWMNDEDTKLKKHNED